jgi:hypothetical protein
LIPQLRPAVEVKSEQTYGATRVDFALEHEDGSVTLVEVKSAVGADFPAYCTQKSLSRTSEKTTVGPVYPSSREPYQRAAIFPHGTTWRPKIRVISERAIKQVLMPQKFAFTFVSISGDLSASKQS